MSEAIKKKQEANAKLDARHKIESPWTIAFRRLKKNRLAMVSLFLLCILALSAILADVITPYDRDQINLADKEVRGKVMELPIKNEAPSSNFILGTDELGRDIFTRLIYGGRISLTVGLVAVFLQVVIGVAVGSAAGFYGGIVDAVLMRLTDIIMCFPFLLIAITVVALLGPSIFNVMFALGLLGWTSIARIVRGQILSLREQEFMEAAEALGIRDSRKIFKHLLPNVMAPIIVFATMGMANAILTESTLSYLGMGVTPPTPTWGNMMQAARSIYSLQNQWWLWIPPGFLTFITVMSFNILGDGLRDALDPKMNR
ncbi:oligopeptide ABC transporter permease [Fusibacter ferrireducens]|nr:oligopeptide ABC transporter permease [Fusibacter ferrireducens]